MQTFDEAVQEHEARKPGTWQVATKRTPKDEGYPEVQVFSANFRADEGEYPAKEHAETLRLARKYFGTPDQIVEIFIVPPDGVSYPYAQ